VKAQEWFHANTFPFLQDPYENEEWENMHAYQRTKLQTSTPPPKSERLGLVLNIGLQAHLVIK
jgi:hypothetical protein